ncbi:hypothetical protein HYV49_04570 [Candidatus Pacearchaeota archaeon]|nr:hypothetical protein [Candidatus Pacearchaeota archaeon]
MELEWRIRNELVELKDNCYVNGRLNKDEVEIYDRRVRFYQSKGINLKVHEQVVEIFYQKLNGIDKRDEDGIL